MTSTKVVYFPTKGFIKGIYFEILKLDKYNTLNRN